MERKKEKKKKKSWAEEEEIGPVSVDDRKRKLRKSERRRIERKSSRGLRAVLSSSLRPMMMRWKIANLSAGSSGRVTTKQREREREMGVPFFLSWMMMPLVSFLASISLSGLYTVYNTDQLYRVIDVDISVVETALPSLLCVECPPLSLSRFTHRKNPHLCLFTLDLIFIDGSDCVRKSRARKSTRWDRADERAEGRNEELVGRGRMRHQRLGRWARTT